MREIKFRGKRADTGEWVYGDLEQNKEGIFISQQFKDFMLSYSWYVIPETVGQYTGIKDRNGKEIYKGDIVKIRGAYYIGSNIELMYYIDYRGSCFYCCAPNGFGENLLMNFDANDIEVVGNIFDNPEFLERDDDGNKNREP